MLTSEFEKLFTRELEKLELELEAYGNEESLWKRVVGINNSAGNLFMHLCGNLQHFIGAILEKTGYVRQRDFEFNGRLSLSEIHEEILTTKKVIRSYFDLANEGSLDDEYPLQPFGYPMTNRFFLIHLFGHLNYHLGQINYHRRILSK